MTNLKPGDKVMIYEDPITRKIEEGTATLIKREQIMSNGFERWLVHFDGDHANDHYYRKLLSSDKCDHDWESHDEHGPHPRGLIMICTKCPAQEFESVNN